MPKIEDQEIIEFIQTKILKKQLAINPETKLFEDGLLNSMNILNLIGFIEKNLGRRIKDSEIVMKNFSSVKAIKTTFFNH